MMAPTITSNSFLLTPTPPSSSSSSSSSSSFRLHNHPKHFLVLAKSERVGPLAAFRLGNKQGGDDSSSTPNKFFDIGNISSDVKSLIPAAPAGGLSFGRRKDPATVFVAGATGQAGIRIAQTLLRQGFTVRAGVPDLPSAQELARIASAYKIISPDESRRLNAVESTFEDAESIAKAIGNAGKVVVTIGPTENGPSSVVTTDNALQVIQASQLAGVTHVAIVYDDKAMAPQSTYNVLDGITSFFNNLFSKSQPLTVSQFLGKIVETDVKYTLLKTSLTDDFARESAYNVVVSSENSSSADYKVSKSQIASLVANVFSNTAVAENKVVRVSTDPSAPSKSVEELFRGIPEDGRRKAYAEALAKAKAEEEEANIASEKARDAAAATRKMKEEVKKASSDKEAVLVASLAQDAQKSAEAAGAAVEDLLSKAKGFSAGFSWDKLSSSISTAAQNPEEKPKVQVATVRGIAKAKTLPAKRAVVKAPSFLQRKEVKAKTQPEKEVRKVLGGFFFSTSVFINR
ncbi:hypothetical protein Syun_015849 [Stephania yunnanensis]|uniref:NAD(P)-binding domain-containing protein n=1 Tax=Stephania yunnanensis TaxID=152371 RepID=A0AAP0J698_9MAGN